METLKLSKEKPPYFCIVTEFYLYINRKRVDDVHVVKKYLLEEVNNFVLRISVLFVAGEHCTRHWF